MLVLAEQINILIEAIQIESSKSQEIYCNYLNKKLENFEARLDNKFENFEARLDTKFNKVCNCIKGKVSRAMFDIMEQNKDESEYVCDEISDMLIISDTHMDKMKNLIEKLGSDILTINSKISEQEHSNLIISNSCKNYIKEANEDFGNTKNIQIGQTPAYSPKPSKNISATDKWFMNYNMDLKHKKIVHTHKKLKFRYSKLVNHNIIDLDYLIKHAPSVKIEQIKNWNSKNDIFKRNGKKRTPVGKCIITVSENDPNFGTKKFEFIVYRKISGMAYLSRKSYSEFLS